MSETAKPDQALVATYAANADEAAFAEIVRRHGPTIYRVCFRILADHHEAEDAVQAAFAILARKASSIRKHDSLGSWLHGVARNVAHLAIRRRIRSRQREQEVAMDTSAAGSDASEEFRQAVLPQLDLALAGLSARQREAVMLRHLEGRSDQEAAMLAGCPATAMQRRAAVGVAKLRRWFARRGVVLTGAVLGTMLASEAGAATPPTLIASILKVSPSVAAGAAAGTAHESVIILVKGAMRMMFWKQVGAAASIAGAVLVLGGGATLAVQDLTGEPPVPPPPKTVMWKKATPKPPVVSVLAQEITVIPRGWNAATALAELGKKGLLAARLGEGLELIVPGGLRFRPVSGRELVEAVAAYHGLEVAWFKDGRVAVIQRGASDAEVERLIADLNSTEAATRRDAAWRVARLEDVRVVEPLLAACADAGEEVSRQAVRSATRWNSEVLAAIAGEKVLPLLEKALADQDAKVRQYAASALGKIGGDKALALIEKALADQDVHVRQSAASSLGHVGGEQALALLEKALADPDADVRHNAVNSAVDALGEVGGDRAVVLIEKVLANQNVNVRWRAADALGRIGGDQALALLGKALDDKDAKVRHHAVDALGEVGGAHAIVLIEKTLDDQDKKVRYYAVSALHKAGGRKALDKAAPLVEKALGGKFVFPDDEKVVENEEEALALIEQAEQALADRNSSIRTTVTIVRALEALDRVGGEKALALIEKALSHQDDTVRVCAISQLGKVGGDQALALLEKALDDQDQDAHSTRSVVTAADVLMLNYVGADKGKTLALIERSLTHQDEYVRFGAACALGRMGEERALPLLDKLLADALAARGRPAYHGRRICVATALSQLGGNQARDLLIRRLAEEKDMMVLGTIRDNLMKYFPADLAVEKALKDFKLPKPEPRREQETVPPNQPVGLDAF